MISSLITSTSQKTIRNNNFLSTNERNEIELQLTPKIPKLSQIIMKRSQKYLNKNGNSIHERLVEG